MSANPRELERKPPPPKPVQGANIPHELKDREIESIKRTLYNAIDKLDRLTSK